MNRAFAELPRTEDGMVIWGDPEAGCPHCGEVDIKISKHNDAVVYHPAVLCCETRLREQISMRHNEVSAIEQEREVRRQAAQEVQDKNPRDIQIADAAWRAFNAWDAASRELEKEIMVDIRDARDRLQTLARQPYKDPA